MFKWDFLYFNLYTFLLVLSLDTTEKNLASSSLQLPIRCLYTLKRYARVLIPRAYHWPPAVCSVCVSCRSIQVLQRGTHLCLEKI